MVSKNKSVDYETLKKELIIEHNNIRKNPKSYIPHLEEHLKYFKGNVLYKPGEIGLVTQEGPSAIKECIKFLNSEKPNPNGIEISEPLSKAAQDHANDIGPKGLISHVGSDKSTSSTRIERYCEWLSTCAENIDFGSYTAKEVILSLIVDDGVPTRGHRVNIFNPALKFFGFGTASHKEYGICVVLSYAGEIGKIKNTKGGVVPKSIDIRHSLVDNNDDKEKEKDKGKYADVNDLNKNMKKCDIKYEDDPFKDDNDAPEDAISCNTSIKTVIEGKKKTVTTTKVYKTSKGQTVTKTIVATTTV